MQSNEYIQFFDGGIEPTLEMLGGKCASLVTMTAAGMPVPPGFVVTTAAFDALHRRQPASPRRSAALLAGPRPRRRRRASTASPPDPRGRSARARCPQAMRELDRRRLRRR